MKMNRNILSILVISVLFLNVVFASNDISFIKIEDKKLYVSLDNVSPQTVVEIQDQEGIILIKGKTASTEKFETVFNFENLSSGKYVLVIHSLEKKIVQPLSLSNNELMLDESKRAKFFPAIFSQKGSKLKLSLLNPSSSEVRVFIIDQKTGRVKYQDMLKGQVVIEKNFNLKDLSNGQYTLVVDNSNEVFTKNINL